MIRALSARGVATTGPVADNFGEAVDILGPPTFGDDTTAVWADGSDAEMVLRDMADAWEQAREAERIAAAAAYAAIRYAANQGMPETRIAEALRVDRMTVRRALGKR